MWYCLSRVRWHELCICDGLYKMYIYVLIYLYNVLSSHRRIGLPERAVCLGKFPRHLSNKGVGVAIGGTIFQNMIRQKLLKYPLLAPMANEYSKDAAGLVQVIKAMESGLAKTQLVQAYADSIKVIWVTMCGLAGVALFTLLFVKEYSMDITLETEQGFKHDGKRVDVESSDEIRRSDVDIVAA